jgi:hypothetical protein
VGHLRDETGGAKHPDSMKYIEWVKNLFYFLDGGIPLGITRGMAEIAGTRW